MSVLGWIDVQKNCPKPMFITQWNGLLTTSRVQLGVSIGREFGLVCPDNQVLTMSVSARYLAHFQLVDTSKDNSMQEVFPFSYRFWWMTYARLWGHNQHVSYVSFAKDQRFAAQWNLTCAGYPWNRCNYVDTTVIQSLGCSDWFRSFTGSCQYFCTRSRWNSSAKVVQWRIHLL